MSPGFYPRVIEFACISGLAVLLSAAVPSGNGPASTQTATQQNVENGPVSVSSATTPKLNGDHPVPGASVKTRPTGTLTSSPTVSPASKLTSSVISRPVATREPLSPYDEELAKTVKFDRPVLFLVREVTHERLQRLVGYDESGYRINALGIAVFVQAEKMPALLAALRAKLRPLNYSAFIVEMNDLLKTDKIGVIKGSDQYEIIRIMHTDGEDDSMATEDIIDRLKEWEKISSFEIIGADNDWVELEFSRLPRDLKSFVEEIYDFSPDAVDEGPGTIDGLVKDILKTKRLFLSW